MDLSEGECSDEGDEEVELIKVINNQKTSNTVMGESSGSCNDEGKAISQNSSSSQRDKFISE